MRIFNIFSSFVLILIICSTLTYVFASPTDELPFAVDGFVSNSNGQPVENAVVTVSNLGTGEEKQTTSSSIGYYGITLTQGVSNGDVIYIYASIGGLDGEVSHALTQAEADGAGLMLNVNVIDNQTTTPPPTTQAPTTQPPTTTSPPGTTAPPTTPQTTIPPTTNPPTSNVASTNPPTTSLPETTMPPVTKDPDAPVTVTVPPTTTNPSYEPSTPDPGENSEAGDEEGLGDYAFYLAVVLVAMFFLYVVKEIRK